MSISGKGGASQGSMNGDSEAPFGVALPGRAHRQMITDQDLDFELAAPEWSPFTTIETTTPAIVSPASGDACLVLLYPPGPDMGRRFPLTGRELVLGRDRSSTIQLDRDSVSRRHAQVTCRGDGWHLQDLESTNGSYVNDVPITEAPLRDGDFVKIGGVIFKFLAGAGIEASYHDELYKLTIKDALTSAHNKRYFLEAVERELFRGARHGRPISLLLLDVDHFKSINDAHGHLTGDHLLRELARRIRERLHPEALLARYGGGEFAVLLPETDLPGARKFGEQVRRLVAEHPFEYDGRPHALGVSIGVACVEGQGLDVPKFLKIAKDNLHRAQREGGNRVVAGATEWHRWRADPAFRSQVSGKAAVAALSLLARDQILASSSGVAYVDDLEGLLYARLREHQQAEQVLSFGALEGGPKLLVATQGRSPVHRLRAILFEALRRCADEQPEARFAVGPIVLARQGARAIEDAVAGLDDEIAILENGHYLPQPLAVSLRALEGSAAGLAKSVIGLGEALLQWLALCAVAELSVHGVASRTAATLRRSLDGGATLGRWHEVLATGIEEILESGSVHDPAWRTCFGDGPARDEVFSWVSSFVELRGAFARGATAADEHVARRLVDEIAPALRQLVKRKLRPVLTLIPAEIKLVGFEGELQSYRMTRLIGDGMAAPVAMYSRKRLNPGLWLCDPSADRAIPLEPYLVRDTCPKCGAREIFLLTRLDELEFRNPASGHVLKKPIDDLPLSPEAREHLLELAGPSSTGARSPHAREAPERPTPWPRILEVGAVTDRQLGSPPSRDPTRPRPALTKHTILFLAANPTGTDRFALDQEARAIQVELERSGFRDCFELVTRWAAEPLDLLRELRKLRPTVIHFSGHSRRGAAGEPWPVQAPPEVLPEAEPAPEHGLYFQGPDGHPQLVSTSALEETFGAAGASVRLVVLNACYSEVQAEALLSRVDCVVGVSGAVRDDAARSFAIGFYGGLGERESIALAYRQGCAAISLEGLRDADRPQLKVRTGVDAARLVLATELP
jgi:diguanylate cyclase (GGDEF)-like protein